ncbi:NADPH-dependent FMN reductase [Streptomyces sp. NPDC020490]|uniref:NADPH-dependent FMN reductase n=1 Tax=Streptomyces sp. NPDC020490 TaxID=3365078 RepID=UPI0037B76277
MPRLYVISASVRSTSAGRPLARWVTELAARQGGFDVELLDLKDVALPFMDESEHPESGIYAHQHTKDWSATIDAGDCFVFVMPMYNRGFGAALKNAIDHLHHEWQNKPVGLISYSAGTSGGAPAIEMLRPVLAMVGLRAAEPTLSIPAIDDHADGEGRFRATPDLEARTQAVLTAVAELVPAAEPQSEPASA